MSSKTAIAAASAAMASITRSSDVAMSDEGLKEVTKTILIRDIAVLPFVKNLIDNFIELAKDEDKYLFQLDPREVKIWETYYPDKLAETASGIAMIEDGIASKNQFIKLITIGQHGFKDSDILRLIDIWMKPDYDRNTTADKPTWDNVKESIMKLYKTMNEFMLKQKQIVTLFLKETGLPFELLRAEVFIPQVAMLHSFIAFHFYYIIGQKEIALFIMTRMEYLIALERYQKGDIAVRPVALRLNDYLKVIGARMEKDVENREANEGAKPTPVNTNAEARAAAKARGNALVAEEEETRKAQELAEQKKREEKAARKAAKAEANRIAAAEKAEANRIAAAEIAEAAERAKKERNAATLKAMQTKKSASVEVEKMTAALKALPPRPSPSPPRPESLPSRPEPSPASLPSSISRPTSATPTVLRASPPTFSNVPRAQTPSLAKTGFTPYSRPSPIIRFWESLDHTYIYQILRDLFAGAQDPNVRFYLKGSAAIHMYKRAHRLSIINHTSDYDTTLLVNPSLPKKNFYDLRSSMLERIMHRLMWAVDDTRFNAEVITKLSTAGIPFASFIYYDASKREPVYAIQDKIPQEHITVPDKSGPRFYSDRENHFPYASYAAKASTGVLNLRILRALETPKNITVIQLYTKTSPEIKLIEVTVPFYEYEETGTQISLADQWASATGIPVIDGVPILSLPALRAEQQKLRTLKDAMNIDQRITDINTLMRAAAGSGSGASARRRRTLKLRR
jgi:hypothetical protein